MPQKIMLPEAVSACCAALRKAGHAAYPVGGGVRDLLLGRTPGDWDVTTSAPPEAILSLFPRATLTGGSHGTVTVIIADTAIEVTPFRGESGYSDGRHPDKVTFGVSLDDDLARRDFTVNALALDEGGGVIDRFGGLEDLKKGVLRCVGEAERRFREDSLRILRALRFAAVYGMVIEGRTAAALHKNRALLGRLPAERVYGELTKLLCGAHAEAVLLEYADVLSVPIPEISPAVGFDQHNPHHCHDIWGHTAAVVAAAPPEPALRWAALFHDLGKPAAFTLDGNGIGHFYGHAAKSAELADAIMGRLRFDNATRRQTLFLVAHHDDHLQPTEQSVKRAIQQFGAHGLGQLLALFRADALGHAPESARQRLSICAALETLLHELSWMGERLTVKDLALSGGDLAALGLSGADIGKAQQKLLAHVLDHPEDNTAGALKQLL